MSVFLGAVADDDTGATDLGVMLREAGMRVSVVTHGDASAFRIAAAESDAVIVGTASRSIARDDCYTRTRGAVQLLKSAGAQRFLIKYCSTFDSTPLGNIGAQIDAAMDELACACTLALPAQPSLGRTTFMGYHFVGDQLLSDSPMRHHPLTPMTNPHLVSHLRTQTKRIVGLLPYATVQGGAETIQNAATKLAQSGINIAICDCVCEAQLHSLGEAAVHMPLLTGSSAWGMTLPQQWQRIGPWQPQPSAGLHRAHGGSGVLCVSGSCSVATRGQVAWARRSGWVAFELATAELVAGAALWRAEQIAAALADGQRVLLTTEQDRALPSDQADSATASIGHSIGQGLAHLVTEAFARQQPTGLIVAGGETSSTLVRALQLGGMRVGPPIQPGVPLCIALNLPSLALALKSGNFGAEDFFGHAAEAIYSLPLTSEGPS